MKKNLNIKISKKIYFINFNQDNSCFCIGNDEGYEIYNTDPFKKIVEKKLGTFGVCYITMLLRTNILGVILKNTYNELHNENTLLIWDDKDNIKDAKISLGAVAPKPIRALRSENILKGKKLTSELILKTSTMAVSEAKPISDVRSSLEYRKRITGVLVKRAINLALERCNN